MPHLDLAYVGPGIVVPPWNRLASPPAAWTTITFSPRPGYGDPGEPTYGDYYDDGHHHSDAGGPSIVNGPAFIHGSLVLRLEGMPVSQVQVRPYLILADGSGQRAAANVPSIWGMAIDEETTDNDHNPAVTHYAVPLDVRVPPGRRLRLEGMQAHDSTEFPDGLIKYAHLVAHVDEL